MICWDCLGKKKKKTGIVKCGGYPEGIHIVPGTEQWIDCPTCNATGELPDQPTVVVQGSSNEEREAI